MSESGKRAPAPVIELRGARERREEAKRLEEEARQLESTREALARILARADQLNWGGSKRGEPSEED